jgi:HSP20 family protein
MARTKQSASRGGVRTISGVILLGADRFSERLAVGTWNPNVDLCETPALVVVRVELPGVELGDVRLSYHSGVLRVQGIKRENSVSPRLLCYYCLERTYGKFDREVVIHRVIDARAARAVLEDGVLTVELPKLADRRGAPLEIGIEKR